MFFRQQIIYWIKLIHILEHYIFRIMSNSRIIFLKVIWKKYRTNSITKTIVVNVIYNVPHSHKC